MKIILCLLFLSLNINANTITQLENKLSKAMTNNSMKEISNDLRDALKKEIEAVNSKIIKKLEKDSRQKFVEANTSWENYFIKEGFFIIKEFNNNSLYGSSGGLSSSRWHIKILKKRYEYLSSLLKSLSK